MPDKRVPTVSDWVLLSLDSFIQQLSFRISSILFESIIIIFREPEVHAVWSITCLLMAASIYPTIRGVFDVIAYQWASTDLDWLLPVLFTVAYSFYHQDVSGHSKLRVILIIAIFRIFRKIRESPFWINLISQTMTHCKS